MNDKRFWLSTWAAVSALWVLYWIGMSLALGVGAIRDMIAELTWPLLVGGLVVSVPATLYLAGTLVACLTRCCRSKS